MSQVMARDHCLFVCLFVVTFKLSYKTGANIMQIGALFALRQPISSNPGAVLFPRLGKINITPDATVIRITVPIPSADWLYTIYMNMMAVTLRLFFIFLFWLNKYKETDCIWFNYAVYY